MDEQQTFIKNVKENEKPLLEMVLDAFHLGILPKSMTGALITLLIKTRKSQ